MQLVIVAHAILTGSQRIKLAGKVDYIPSINITIQKSI